MASPIKDCAAPTFPAPSELGEGTSLPTSPRDPLSDHANYSQRILVGQHITTTTVVTTGAATASASASTSSSPLAASSAAASAHQSSHFSSSAAAAAASPNALVFSLQCPRPPLPMPASSTATPTVLSPQMPAALPPPGALNPISHPPQLPNQSSKSYCCR